MQLTTEQHQARYVALRSRQAEGHTLDNADARDFDESVRIAREAHHLIFWELLHQKAESGLDADHEAQLDLSRDLLGVERDRVHHDLNDLKIYYAMRGDCGRLKAEHAAALADGAKPDDLRDLASRLDAAEHKAANYKKSNARLFIEGAPIQFDGVAVAEEQCAPPGLKDSTLTEAI